MKKYFAPLIGLLFLSSCNGQQSPVNIVLDELNSKLNTLVYPNIDAIIVKTANEIIIEEYYNEFGRDSLHDIRSAFKSITSLLAGIAIDKGLISLDDKLNKFFPKLPDKRKSNITVKDLLEMKSGLDCEEFYGIGPDCETPMWETQDWINYCINLQMKDEPGMNWAYNSIESMLIGEIISRASNKTIMEFAKQHLFSPLDITNYKWTITPQGRGMTAGSFYIRPIDMLKIIELVKNKGKWGDKIILSKEWIEYSTDCKTDIDFSFVRYSRMDNAKYQSARYGYYWYRENLQFNDINTEVLFASGNGGQYMMNLEAYDSMIIFTGSNYGNWRNKLPFEILLKYLIPIIENKKAGKNG